LWVQLPPRAPVFYWSIPQVFDFSAQFRALSGIKPQHTEQKTKLPTTWPVEVKRQAFTVKIYKVDRSSGYTEFKLGYYAYGKRIFRTFADYDEPYREAGKVGATLSKGDAQSLRLTSIDRLAFLREVDVLRPTGVSLDIAAHQFADAHKRLAGRSIGEAVEFFLKRDSGKLLSKTAQKAVAEFIAFTRQNSHVVKPRKSHVIRWVPVPVSFSQRTTLQLELMLNG
jgi:hypothetical protein